MRSIFSSIDGIEPNEWHRACCTRIGGMFMDRNVKFLGHPAHQQLIVFPMGLFITAAIFDLFSFSGDFRLTQMAFYLFGVGILMGLAAALFGLMDWIQVPNGTRARRVGALHGVGNLLVVLLFIAS